MSSSTEKQSNFFKVVAAAKSGKPGITGAAKKAAKTMTKKQINDFLKIKKENMNFNDTVNHYLTNIFTEKTKTRLDKKCWSGWHKEGTKIKGGVRVNNCVKNSKRGS